MTELALRPRIKDVLNLAVIVAALGYFVDIYDLVLFTIIRVPSLKSLGIGGQQLMDQGLYLLNMQMAGMLIGGVVWGVLGDKRGRLSVLFGSIILYSLANIANGFVQSIEQYSYLRFIAGLGLAGELGAGITLVSEILHKEHRGYGTMIVTSVGVSGAVFAALIAMQLDWRTCYFIGGALGLALLLLRVRVLESGMYKMVKHSKVRRGHFISLFTSWHKFGRYLRCIMIGLPTWYLVGILITLAPEIARALHVTGEITSDLGILFFYGGLTIGDFASGTISQLLRTRKKVVAAFLLFCSIFVAAYFLQDGTSPAVFYLIVLLMGIGAGYWALFVTIAAEQFGTNLRATVATTVPNFVRGALVGITVLFTFLRSQLGLSYTKEQSLIYAASITGALCMVIALLALVGLHETFGRDLDYIED